MEQLIEEKETEEVIKEDTESINILIKELETELKSYNLLDSDTNQKLVDFLDWTKSKSKLIFEKDTIDIPKEWLPNEITTFQYEKFTGQLEQDDMDLINKYYIKKIIADNIKILLTRDAEPSKEEKYRLSNLLIFQQKNVVWVEFGINVGSEFSGKHPALIMKNAGDNLIVIPLSSQEPLEKKDYHVKVDKVFSLPRKIRWANIHRMTPISIFRIDFNSHHGTVNKPVMNAISEAINKCGVK